MTGIECRRAINAIEGRTASVAWLLPGDSESQGDIILLRRAIFGLLALFLLTACDERALIAEHTPPEALSLAHLFFDHVRKGDLAALEKITDVPGMTNDQRRAALHKMIDAIPKIEPQSSEVLGVTFNYQVNKEKVQLILEYRIGEPSVLAEIHLERWTGHEFRVTGANFEVLPTSFAAINAFTLVGKPVYAYLILAGAILVPLFSLGTAIFIWFRPNLRHKWLWIPFALLVLLRLDLNWTTGIIDYQPFYIGIFPITIDQEGPSGPWLFQLSFPIGALIFWLFRPGGRKRRLATDITVFD